MLLLLLVRVLAVDAIVGEQIDHGVKGWVSIIPAIRLEQRLERNSIAIAIVIVIVIGGILRRGPDANVSVDDVSGDVIVILMRCDVE